ncbi:uncharacterized protein LOC118241681 isoform X2 [Electrophorus electricus]|uniref:uncharacterized protein LOC118241681 isoform X2 n=1 Tax=Electrophorus electricus TaxID=8005 RepID=UPI0015CFB9EB|nr:uncharacterized protein LOC118241681 isoform X2 [Electrophorus electricus]
MPVGRGRHSSAGMNMVPVSKYEFKEVGSSFQLDMPKNVHFAKLTWMFNSKFMLKCNSGEVVHFPAYNGRVEFNNTTFSLTLKNLTKNDAGTYTVKGDDEEGENIIVVHTLTVLDPVVAPKLDFLPQQNKGTCNVTCESQGLSVSTSCYNEICEAKNKTSSDLNLSLHGNGTTVSCTVRIKAISKHTTQNVTFCFHKGKSNNSSANARHSGQSCAVVVFTVLLILVTVS